MLDYDITSRQQYYLLIILLQYPLNALRFRIIMLIGDCSVHIKGAVPRDFQLLVFSWISFPQAPEYSAIQICLKTLGDIRGSRCTTGVIDTFGKWKNGNYFV